MKKSCIPYVVLRKTQENKGSLNADAGQRFNNTSAIEKKDCWWLVVHGVSENSACLELLRHMAPMSPWPKRIMILGSDSFNGKHEKMRGKQSNNPYLG
jgi:hypothetical protein